MPEQHHTEIRDDGFHCFVCKQQIANLALRSKTGKRKDGSRWSICSGCHKSTVTTDSGGVKMGWNGVPSAQSLKRRSR